MRISQSFLVAGALLVAVPASAQNNAEPVANTDTVAVNAVTANAVLGNQAAPATTTAPVTAPEEPAPAPAQRSFPWGVLGLIGLIGLLGVRKAKS